jgi:hypothetical protein
MWEAGWGIFACFTCFACCVFQYRYILYNTLRLSVTAQAASTVLQKLEHKSGYTNDASRRNDTPPL